MLYFIKAKNKRRLIFGYQKCHYYSEMFGIARNCRPNE